MRGGRMRDGDASVHSTLCPTAERAASAARNKSRWSLPPYLLEDVAVRGVLQEPRKLRVRAGLLNEGKRNGWGSRKNMEGEGERCGSRREEDNTSKGRRSENAILKTAVCTLVTNSRETLNVQYALARSASINKKAPGNDASIAGRLPA